MTIYPGAVWEPITGHTDGPFRLPILGAVLHCNGTVDNAPHTDLHNFMQASTGASAVSCHFQAGKDGTLYQYIDTSFTAWCQGDGNAQYLSIETEGQAGEPATPQQVQSIGELLAWLHTTHSIPLQLADKPGQHGFGWHGMGAANGANWGHALCPGVRKDQRNAMLMIARALGPLGSGTEINDMGQLDSFAPGVREALINDIRDAVLTHNIDATSVDGPDLTSGTNFPPPTSLQRFVAFGAIQAYLANQKPAATIDPAALESALEAALAKALPPATSTGPTSNDIAKATVVELASKLGA